MKYTPFYDFIKLPKSHFDVVHRGNQFLEPKPMTIAALRQFDLSFGAFQTRGRAERFASDLNGGSFARANIIGSVDLLEGVIRGSHVHFVQGYMSTWGKHALTWLEQSCVYDLDGCCPDHDRTLQIYDSYIREGIIPDYIFQAVLSLPKTKTYVRLRDKMMQFKLAATENAGMYEMR